jgi:hypothetical protein
MFSIKPNIIAIVITKKPKPNHVVVNVIDAIMTCSQVLEQQVFKELELVKAKAIANSQTKEQANCVILLFIILRSNKEVT